MKGWLAFWFVYLFTVGYLMGTRREILRQLREDTRRWRDEARHD